MDVVGEPVEQCTGEPLGTKHAGPFVEWQVRGNDGRTALISLAEHLEQQLSAGLRERPIAKLVDDQELVSGELPLQAKQPLLVAGLQQFMDESRGGIEADRQPLLTGCETEPKTDMGLAGAGVADRDDVLPAGHILRAGELQNESLVERRNGGEVEAVQALYGWEPRLLDPTLHHASFAVDQFQFGPALS